MCKSVQEYAEVFAQERVEEKLNEIIKSMLLDGDISTDKIARLCHTTIERVQEIRAVMVQEIVDDFIERVDPYMDLKPLKFDLRGYSRYLSENNLDGRDVPEEVIERFRVK